MDWIVSIDFAILDFIQNTMVNPVLNIIMMIFSYLGEAGAIWIIAAIIMLFFRKTRATGVIMLAAMALGLLVGELCMKNIICRSRPFLVNTSVKPFIHAPLGYSFPSGHTTTSFAAAMVIAVREKRAWGITAYVLAALIAFSRLYNYVHYPTDVLAGILLGSLCALLMLFVFQKTGLTDKLSGNQIKTAK